MMDDPEVTIEPADNGYIVKHYQRSTKKDEGGRTIRRVASTAEEALGHAGKVLSTKTNKKRSVGHSTEAGAEISSPAAHSPGGHARGARRRRPRVGGRR